MFFFPKADAAVLSTKHSVPSERPEIVAPIYGPIKPLEPWSSDFGDSVYPSKTEPYATSTIPNRPTNPSPDRFLHPRLAKNEKLRLSMLWYYARDILQEPEFLSGLQQKVHLARESTEWEFAIIGILDVNAYTRLATAGLPLAKLPRGETTCAHTINQTHGNVFLLPSMEEDWRFQYSPHVESAGLRAYAGAPLRMQTESGGSVAFGSFCVASSMPQKPLTKSQQQTLINLADWVVSDIVQCARARRQRCRRRMTELLSAAQGQMEKSLSADAILEIVATIYPDAIVKLRPSGSGQLEIDGGDPVLLSDIKDGGWEDTKYLDGFILNSNHHEPPSDKVVRLIAVPCESKLGPSILYVATKDFRFIFDDVDLWFIQTCASMLSQIWHRLLLEEAMDAKEKFLRGISHQLRTPIHGILGSVELLAEELVARGLLLQAASKPSSGSPHGSHSLYLDAIKTSGRDLVSIVNSMITLNRWTDIAIKDRCCATRTIQELEAELAGEVAKAFSEDSRYRSSVFFTHDPATSSHSLRSDHSLLQDSLFPLILNAVQNTPRGTVLVNLSLDTDSRELVVDIKDTGHGIHPEDQERIFEPYEKVDVHSPGAGLGLTLASKFATLLHGSITLVSSFIGKGSHFRATFREVDWLPATLPTSPIPKLEYLPSQFFRMPTGVGDISLSDHFARGLEQHGFTSLDTNDNCFAVIDFLPDLEQHNTHLSQIPPGQVAICLVSASDAEACPEQNVNNVVYISGPFHMATMSSTLIEADKRHSAILSSLEPQPTPDTSSLTHPVTDEPSCPDSETVPKTASAPSTTQVDGLSTSQNSSDTVVLPIHERAPLEASPETEAVTLMPLFPFLTSSSKPKALLVDDNNINLRIMQMYCSKRGLDYVCATDGAQAVGLFKQHQSLAATGCGTPFQLILMDLQMPVCDGLDATRQIRLLEKEINWGKSILFIVTGQDNPSDRESANAVGADEYYVKPVGIKTLDHAVKRHFPAFIAG